MRHVLSALFILLLATACGRNTSHIRSQGIDSPLERIHTLEKYFNLRTPVQDAEFDIFDVNLNTRGSIPGPTSRDYKIALLLLDNDIDAWLSDVSLTSFPLSTDWARALVSHNKRFSLQSVPLMYTAKDKEILLYRDESILCIRIKQD